METCWDLVLELSREPFEIEQRSKMLKCAHRWGEQSIHRVFHCKSPEFQVIVADVTNGWRVMETPWDILLELSREPFEIEQICQWLKCATRWEEQSINSVFLCKSPGSQVIVADVKNGRRVMETCWDLVLELSREPFEIEQICQWLQCAPRWEEQSINRVFYCKTPAWISSYFVWCNKLVASNGNPLEPCTWIISRTIWDRTNMSLAKMCASMRRTIY